MEFFCYHRDRPSSVALRDELLEEHWSYMDRYSRGMIARGPTLAADGDTATGSVHILDLPDPAAARAFAFDEPNHQAGGCPQGESPPAGGPSSRSRSVGGCGGGPGARVRRRALLAMVEYAGRGHVWCGE